MGEPPGSREESSSLVPDSRRRARKPQHPCNTYYICQKYDPGQRCVCGVNKMTAVLRAARGIFSVAGLRTSMRGSTVAVRSFSANNAPSGQGHIADDVEGLVGKARSEAIFKRAFGEEWFEREGTAAFEEGTRENPIPILSTEAERCVGVSLPVSARPRWAVER
jgi:hypothetical protein